jgi:hypothetical protein
VGEELLHGPGVAFHEFVQRQLILLDELIDLAYGRHLEITSMVEAFSWTLRDHPTLFTQRRGKQNSRKFISTILNILSYRAGPMRHLAALMDRMLPQHVVGLDKDSLS